MSFRKSMSKPRDLAAANKLAPSMNIATLSVGYKSGKLNSQIKIALVNTTGPGLLVCVEQAFSSNVLDVPANSDQFGLLVPLDAQVRHDFRLQSSDAFKAASDPISQASA